MSEINKVVKTKKSFPFGPFLVFALVVAGTIGLYFYNMKLQKDITEEEAQVASYQKEIDSLVKNKNIQIAKLLKNNADTLKKLEERSRISKYIDHLSSIWGGAIKFNGFDLKDGKITTEAEVSSILGKQSYTNTADFIKRYRAELEKDEMFDLAFVNSIEGSDPIKFSAEFTIKDKKAKTEKTKNTEKKQERPKINQKKQTEKKQETPSSTTKNMNQKTPEKNTKAPAGKTAKELIQKKIRARNAARANQ